MVPPNQPGEPTTVSCFSSAAAHFRAVRHAAMRRVLSSEEPHLVPRWSRNCMKIRLLPFLGLTCLTILDFHRTFQAFSIVTWMDLISQKLAIFVRAPIGKTSNCIPGWPQRGRLQARVDPPAAPGKVIGDSR
ncbi:hypothetical protein LZ31DRAFT_561427 [Colletotrichum somersetense]|nr:hypothetical protein LZ31DRAFT_561427 [Colletotrichum somersetense]